MPYPQLACVLPQLSRLDGRYATDGRGMPPVLGEAHDVGIGWGYADLGSADADNLTAALATRHHRRPTPSVRR
ncbi:hypothetical protein [Nocardia anaemiae]|uniref:hypothetical protein n=1 Tax=Nocardia anaemiae TaxID=263910 RepID=UPI0007A46ACA|nr:hypothetical protein [Nocardia anaemiae]